MGYRKFFIPALSFSISPLSGKYFFLGFFGILTLSLYAQNIPESFKQNVDSIIAQKPKTFTEIHSVFRSQRTDTVLMRYLEKKAEEAQYNAGLAYALNELGRTYRKATQYTKAIYLHQKALKASKAIDDIELEIASLNYLGVVYSRTASIRVAMDYNQKALELAETVENPSKGIKRGINVALNCIGNLYQTLKQYDLAIATFRKSLRLEGELNNLLGLAVNYQNIGECLEYQGNLTEALENYRTSLKYNEEIDSDAGRVICHRSIGQIYIKQGNIKGAIRLLEPTLAMAEKIGNDYFIIPIQMNLGWAQMLQGEYDRAKENMMQSLEKAEKFNLEEYSSKTSNLLSELFKRQGAYKEALEYKVKAQEIEEEILQENTIRYVNDIIFRYDSEKKNNEIEQLARDNEIVRLKLRKNNTTLFVGLIGIALLSGIFYILYRQNQLKNEKKLLTLEQTMLRSQMNPHFLFNSLNSIKLYIINNEKKNAVYYLNKFSKLVRKILEASSLKEIQLSEELETVELYMNIENIRFSNEIDFKIIIEEGIDVNNIKIPSLILQPFLENALWHGLSSKEGEKKIQVHIRRQDDYYIDISITDNGVGRDASEKIKESKVLKRKSVGIDITKERLANFSKDFQNTFDVEIVDLFDAQNKAAGTRVVLHIPTI